MVKEPTRDTTYVVGRDRKRKRVLLGGLGFAGVGEMWFDEEGNRRERGFKNAPEMDEDDEGTFLSNVRRAAAAL